MPTFRRAYANVTTQTDVIMITHDVKRVFAESGAAFGLLSIFMPIGTSGVAILENDPKIGEDYKKWIEDQIPATSEKRPERRSGSGRNFAHLRAQCVGHSLSIPIAEGKLQISPWQEIFLFDFDDKVGRREFFILVVADGGSGEKK